MKKVETIKVKFSDVGRSSASWEEDFKAPLTDAAIAKAVRARRVLLSKFVDIQEDGNSPEGPHGSIWAGVRCVGYWRVVPRPVETPAKDKEPAAEPATTPEPGPSPAGTPDTAAKKDGGEPAPAGAAS